MNEVEETLRCINNDISLHQNDISKLNRIWSAIKINDYITDDLKKNIFDIIEFKNNFHKHKISRLGEEKDLILKKYDMVE